MNETINYSIARPDGTTTKLSVSYDDIGGYQGIPAKSVTIQLDDGKPVTIEPQQLTEIAALFLGLSGVVNIDYSGAEALLEGFSLRGKEAAKQLAKALEE